MHICTHWRLRATELDCRKEWKERPCTDEQGDCQFLEVSDEGGMILGAPSPLKVYSILFSR